MGARPTVAQPHLPWILRIARDRSSRYGFDPGVRGVRGAAPPAGSSGGSPRNRMRRRTLITALAATAAFGAAATPAQAALRRVQVTLVTGQQLTLAVHLPPGTHVAQVT